MINLFVRRRKTIFTAECILSKGFSTSSISAKDRNRGHRKIATMGAPQEAITEDEIVGMELPDKANSKNACK